MKPSSALLMVRRRMHARRRVVLAAVEVRRKRGRSRKWKCVEHP